MGTMLHEFGHAVYFKYHDEALPWTLKTPAHIFTPEAIAMLFERFSTNPVWMQEMLGIPAEEVPKIADVCKKSLRLEQLVFSRWSQVMYRFEKSLYENPDQDLNKLWWDLVERYQMIKRPADRNLPDWATKIHIATSPCYYHNYHLGALFASQLQDYVNHKLLNLPEG
ncbi:MAG: M2 family metallopeptidase, partial [Bacteroidales bacterium]|nr:M2 family metallopeptidase [Bacteroidales bacterium]